MDRHYSAGPGGCGLGDSEDPGFVFRIAYVSVARSPSVAENYGTWLYDICTVPNMLDGNFAEGEIVNESAWIGNPDYDSELYERSGHAAGCRVTGEDEMPPALADLGSSGSESDSSDRCDRRYQSAMQFMDGPTMDDALAGDFPPLFAQYPERIRQASHKCAPAPHHIYFTLWLLSCVESRMANTMPRGYLSATEYRFREDQTHAIIRTSAYHRKDFCLSVIWFSPREHQNVRDSIANPFERASQVGMGTLDRLPLELLHDVLLYLDVQSLFFFRQTGIKSRQMVHSLKQYRMVVVHGLNLFCALLRTRLANSVSLFDTYHALCTKACEFCGEFAGFMSLLTWNRCCFKCLQEAPETQVQSLASVRKQFRLTKTEMCRLISFKTLPGIYSMEESLRKSRIAVVSMHQAMSVAGQRPPARAQLQAADWGQKMKLNFMGSCALPFYDRQTGEVEHGISCAGCQLALEKHIIGSRGEDWAFEARNKVYSQAGFLKHFIWCEQAQLLWKSSGDGQHKPCELPEAVRRGGYFNKRE
ncbi:hypothetical protein HIM_04615 [Hirsutella minnesotensis 3608]|uniref:F-box domain-containing protein n=1 Tax=Hirsutella minnesotensis 3608 TaxID=1043627 RepID=A0A0F8A5Y9_9HYPO|nr:hypothetical protein HIM_04615 [Hirsutella minnesotensis 3608]